MTSTDEVKDLERDAQAAVLKRLITAADAGQADSTVLRLAEAYQHVADARRPTAAR